MSDNYTIYKLKCGYCGIEQEEVWYGESSGAIEHKCEDCGKINKIQQIFQLIKMKK